MRFITPIELISERYIKDNLKQQISTKTYKKIFAAKKSAKQSEFFNAAAKGLKPDKTFIVHTMDYNNQTILRYPTGEEGKIYSIYRTYDREDECLTELHCEVRVGG